jgi:selenocysteine lyase/cysteine desulfurase
VTNRALASRPLFAGLRDVAYLNTAAESPGPASLAAALARYADDKALGSQGRTAMYAVEERCRGRVAALLGGLPEDVAFTGSCAHGINAVLAAVRFRPGDALVTSDLEFPTVDLAAARLRRAGVEIRLAHAVGGAVAPEALVALLHRRVRAMVVSLVSFKTGAMLDLVPVSAACRATGTLLVVDATQALGAVTVAAELADVVVASCFKWLLGAHGAAVLYVRGAAAVELEPEAIGWRSIRDPFADVFAAGVELHADARRFEEGMPPFPALYALEAGLEVLAEHDPATVARHVRALGGRLREELTARGFTPLGPAAEAERAGIVAVADSHAEQHAEELRERGVVIWGRDGRLRASVHLYNDDSDIDRLIEAFPRRVMARSSA